MNKKWVAAIFVVAVTANVSSAYAETRSQCLKRVGMEYGWAQKDCKRQAEQGKMGKIWLNRCLGRVKNEWKRKKLECRNKPPK